MCRNARVLMGGREGGRDGWLTGADCIHIYNKLTDVLTWNDLALLEGLCETIHLFLSKK